MMGAHHHYANCAEGTNFVDFDSIHFSTLNRQVVRGHAVDFASP